jgi:hypothetical protein
MDKLALFIGAPAALAYVLGFFAGRYSRDAEVSALKFQYEAAKGMAINNAAVADKVIAEISKISRGRDEPQAL